MVDEGRVARLLRDVEARIGRLDGQRGRTAEAVDQPLWLDGIKYLFVTAIEGCVDVAHHIAASERWEAPDTNAAAFGVLAAHDVLGEATARRLARAVGFRNVLVHQYAAVDDELVLAALDELDDLRAFVAQVSAWMVAQR